MDRKAKINFKAAPTEFYACFSVALNISTTGFSEDIEMSRSRTRTQQRVKLQLSLETFKV
jgi:hypothetical protein